MTISVNKPLTVTIGLVLLLTAYFWLGSRYPDLDQKALMGGETQLAAIGFDTIVDIPANATLAWQIPYNTLNWMYTNWRGMTFGILLGGLLLTLLPLLGQYRFQNGLLNSIMGMLIGAPLGVCVNCVAPIAQGMFAAGTRTEMALATMFSSPTLNVIVLTMVFALFPTYMAVTKVGMTLLFVLVGIPLLTRLLPFAMHGPTQALAPPQHKAGKFDTSFAFVDMAVLPTTWAQSVGWVLTQFSRNLWYIIKTTVPLMLLAGFLGAVVVTLLPLTSLADLLPSGGRGLILASMAGIAVLGLFLPVPMAFDVIVTAILLQAGMPVSYAMVLLFTLGIFSIYPFALIWQTVSKLGALALFIILAGLGVVGGVGAHEYAHWDNARQQDLVLQRIAEEAQAPVKPAIDRSQQGQPQTELVPFLQQSALIPEKSFTQGNLLITSVPFSAKAGQSEQFFSRIEGNIFGITEHDNFSINKFSFRLAKLRGIAAGDVHNDGWPDLVIASDTGVGLYANLQGEGYQQQRLDIPQINEPFVGTVALVDLNNDGWLDLFVSTFSAGNYLIYNQDGHFAADRLREVPNHPEAILTNAPAFGDIDRNGELDIVLGNATIGNVGQQASLDAARNVWLKQINKDFTVEMLPAIAGETLTTLLTDLNHDGWLDLIVGNEFRAPDFYYRNDGQGHFELVVQSDGLVPHTGSTTMSLSSADINNDLIPEIFLAQKAWERGNLRPLSPEEICAEIETAPMHQTCIEMLRLRDATLQAINQRDVFTCLQLATAEQQNGCLALKTMLDAWGRQDAAYCQLLAKGWPALTEYCLHYFGAVTEPTALQLTTEIPQINNRNVLFVQDEAGNYKDQADAFGLRYGGWAWNAKFADLDNDGWLDLLIVTGDLTVRLRHSNYLFRNQQGEGFENVTAAAGLHSYLDTLAYTYTDLDNDGDLDIITVPAAGPIAVYRNNTQSGHAIAFELRDTQGNHFGIGSRITIYYGDGQHQIREIQASGGFLSFDAPVAHFGLGEHEQIDRVDIHWSTGEVNKLTTPFMAGARYVITRQAQE